MVAQAFASMGMDRNQWSYIFIGDKWCSIELGGVFCLVEPILFDFFLMKFFKCFRMNIIHIFFSFFPSFFLYLIFQFPFLITLIFFLPFLPFFLEFFFFLYIYDIQFTQENKIYNHQVHWKYMHLEEKVKIKKRTKNAINNIKKSIKKLNVIIYLNI